jgi:pimeloyl-ACP methyl ester carboxylesterase
VVVEGVAVEFQELGPRGGDPVVLLHGLLGSPAYLEAQARVLVRDGRRVLMPDLFGHGGSGRLSPFTFPRAADLLAAAAGELGAEIPAVFGHSFGAPLAVHWAARHPARSLVAASPVGLAPLGIGWTRHLIPFTAPVAAAARAAAPLAASTAIGRRFVFGWFVGMRRPQAVDPALGERLIRGAAAAAPCLADVLPELERLGLERPAAAVPCPALTVWGDCDPHGLANGPRLAAALHGEWARLPGCGHMPMLEAPYAFRRLLVGWL